ncbi:MAG TPA: succinylglutamate desuccinylase/aspartoacylase family protein [Gammaproteobacteria bacterium]|nr:succinylglutamate desuccinylase/aspartoacylase family protein [Gammaproteobacteria bacterium]
MVVTNMSERTDISLPGNAPGCVHNLSFIRYGAADTRPKAYIQAALHADETPGLLVMHHLRHLLDEAEAAGEITGQIVLAPIANPIGLGQVVSERVLGRYDLAGRGNFNRDFPQLLETVAERAGTLLTKDSRHNVKLIRAALKEAAKKQLEQAIGATETLKCLLLEAAIDADICLDLHCDLEALMHIYLGTPLWPNAQDLPTQLGAATVLLASNSGGQPFDEAVASPWWELAQRYNDFPIPAACLSATVELRGQGDVNDKLAAEDARNILTFLHRRGLLSGTPAPLPAAVATATPLSGVEYVRSRVTGVVSFLVEPGELVETGQPLAVIIDPLAATPARGRTTICSGINGQVFAHARDHLVRPGTILCTIAGKVPLPRKPGTGLLSD